eukprot:5519631-Prymnesium_polylepis.1
MARAGRRHYCHTAPDRGAGGRLHAALAALPGPSSKASSRASPGRCSSRANVHLACCQNSSTPLRTSTA